MTVLQEAPEGAAVIDIVAARAARAEVDAQLPPIFLKIDAGFIELRRELDVLCAEDFVDGRFRAGLSKILADPADVEPIVAYGLSSADLERLIEHITGKPLGE